MAIVRPFKGLRPTARLAERIAALPYDVMTSEEARRMVKDNPHSFLHVDRAEIDFEPGVDPYSPQVYEKAAENLTSMIKKGYFIQDREPCFYIYRLTMIGHSQTGLVACTSIDEYLNGSIKKHELTRADKEKDRIRHVDVTNANTGPIFLCYPFDITIQNIINGWSQNFETIYDFISEDGIRHEVWIIDNQDIIRSLQNCFLQVPALYIADGHHRNASAVKVGLRRREQNPGYSPDDEFNYYLSVLFSGDQLCIMNYNRLVKDLNGLTSEQFLEALGEHFEIIPSKHPFKPRTLHTFGMYLDGAWYKLIAGRELVDDEDAILSLDVSILQNEVLSKILGIGDPRVDERIDFVGGIRGLEELERRVDSGEMRLAFAMCPTTTAQLMEVADEGKIMPPKSTWFEPKLRSGLFIHKLD